MGRKNWLFCWTEVGARHAGIMQSLFVTCRLHDIDPYTYLVDVLQRVGEHSASRVAELAPWLWKQHFADNPLRSDLYKLYARAGKNAVGLPLTLRETIVTLTQQPVDNTYCQSYGGQAKHAFSSCFLKIQDNEFTSYSKQGNEQDDLRLNDALLPSDHVLEGMVEFQRDQYRHDLAKDVLEHLMVERVHGAKHEAIDNSGK